MCAAKKMNSEYDILKKQIGHNIRSIRERRGITVANLAELLGISTAFLGLIERGQRGLAVMKLLNVSKVLNCSLEEIISSDVSHLYADPADDTARLQIYLRNNGLATKKDIDFIISTLEVVSKYK